MQTKINPYPYHKNHRKKNVHIILLYMSKKLAKNHLVWYTKLVAYLVSHSPEVRAGKGKKRGGRVKTGGENTNHHLKKPKQITPRNIWKNM